jgi:hypothetical protein
MKPRIVLPLLLLFALLSAGIAYWVLTRHRYQRDGLADGMPPSGSTAEVRQETETEEVRRMLLGVWQDDYQGRRTMTLNEDGTATMLVELSGVQSFLVAPKLRFDMTWSLDGKKLTKKTVSGEPADKVRLILNAMGDTAEDTLLEITEDRLVLLDKNGTTKYEWRRVTQHESGKE